MKSNVGLQVSYTAELYAGRNLRPGAWVKFHDLARPAGQTIAMLPALFLISGHRKTIYNIDL